MDRVNRRGFFKTLAGLVAGGAAGVVAKATAGTKLRPHNEPRPDSPKTIPCSVWEIKWSGWKVMPNNTELAGMWTARNTQRDDDYRYAVGTIAQDDTDSAEETAKIRIHKELLRQISRPVSGHEPKRA